MPERSVRESSCFVGPELAELLDAARGADLPVLLSGRHGIGKSEFVSAWARDRGMVAHVLDLSLLEATDLTGLPEIREGRTRYAPPALLPSADAPSVLVLEELNRCDRSVRQPCLQLLTTRRLNEYVLPRNCFLVACVNPSDQGYDVDELDAALASRFVVADVHPDRTRWLDWAREHDIHSTVVGFVERHAQSLETVPPRTWTYVSRLLSSAERQGLQKASVNRLLGTLLPPMAAKAIAVEMARSQERSPTAEQILRDPQRHAQRLADLVAAGRVDRVQDEITNIAAWLDQNPVRADSLTKALAILMEVVPADLRCRLESGVEAR